MSKMTELDLEFTYAIDSSSSVLDSIYLIQGWQPAGYLNARIVTAIGYKALMIRALMIRCRLGPNLRLFRIKITFDETLSLTLFTL